MSRGTHEIRMAHWKGVIRQCQSRQQGQTATEWLDSNGINRRQYYYWLRQIRQEAYKELKKNSLPAASASAPVSFAEIPV